MSKTDSILDTTKISLPSHFPASHFPESKYESDAPSPFRRTESSSNLFANLGLNNMDYDLDHFGSYPNLPPLNLEEEDEFMPLPLSDLPITPPQTYKNFYTPKKQGMSVRVVHFNESVKARAFSYSDDDNKMLIAEVTGHLKPEAERSQPIYAHSFSHPTTPVIQAALDALSLLFDHEDPPFLSSPSSPLSMNEDEQPQMPSPPYEKIVDSEEEYDALEQACAIELQSQRSIKETSDDSSLDDCHGDEGLVMQPTQILDQTPAAMLLAAFFAASQAQDKVVVVGQFEYSSPIILGADG